MRILIIGAGGTIGNLITPALSAKHEIITAGRKTGDIKVDISLPFSIENLFEQVKSIDACVCLAGDSYAGDIQTLTEEKLHVGIINKLVGQANLVLIGQKYLNENGSFTLTSGKMGDKPSKNAAAKAIANGGVNSFVLAASLEMERGIRINVISPAKVADIPVSDLVNGYVKSIEGSCNGEILRIGY